MNFDKILTNMKDYHIPVCVGVFLLGSMLQWFHHMDPSFVAYTGTVLAAITGHAFSGAGKPDDPSKG
jgi:hypothetical protein